MAGLMDELGKAVGKAVDGAKDLFEKAKPAVAGALDKMGDGAKNLADKAKGAAEGKPDLKGQISDEVKAQVEQIRNAAVGTDSIHDYIQGKFAKTEEKMEEAKEEADKAIKEIADDAKQEADKKMQDFAEGARQAADKAEAATQDVLKAVGDGVRTLADKVKDTFEQVKGETAKAVEAAKQEADAQPEATAGNIETVADKAEVAAETIENAADKAESATEAAKEIILEGPSAETLSEVFETDTTEEPASEETMEE